MIENYKYLYRVNPIAFRELSIPMITHYIPIAISIAYTLLIQLRVTTLRNMMILNGTGALIGALTLYLIMRGIIKVTDGKKLLLFSKAVMVVNRISVLLLLLFPDKWFTPLILLTTVYTGTTIFPLLNSSIQYVVFKKYDLQNKARITNAFMTTFNLVVITVTFIASLLYKYLTVLYFTAIVFEAISLITFYKLTGDFTINHTKVRISKYFDKKDLKLFSFIFIFSMSMILIAFIKPVVFKTIGEQYVGSMFSIAGILSVIITYYGLKTFTSGKTLIKTFTTLFVIGLLFILSFTNPYLQVLLIIVSPPILTSSIYSYRHLVFSRNGSESVWVTTAFNEFIRASTNIILPILALIPDINKNYILSSIGIILILTSYMIFSLSHSRPSES